MVDRVDLELAAEALEEVAVADVAREADRAATRELGVERTHVERHARRRSPLSAKRWIRPCAISPLAPVTSTMGLRVICLTVRVTVDAGILWSPPPMKAVHRPVGRRRDEKYPGGAGRVRTRVAGPGDGVRSCQAVRGGPAAGSRGAAPHGRVRGAEGFARAERVDLPVAVEMSTEGHSIVAAGQAAALATGVPSPMTSALTGDPAERLLEERAGARSRPRCRRGGGASVRFAGVLMGSLLEEGHQRWPKAALLTGQVAAAGVIARSARGILP